MTTRPVNLDAVRIATPCPISWEQMTGDSRVRFCDLCQLNVYNISELSRVETEHLIASTEGRLCARLFRRADGTVLTKDCPVGLRALRMRLAKRTAAIFAAIVSLSAVALGQDGKKEKTACTPQTKITRAAATADPNKQGLSGTVVDPIGATIPGAKVKIINAAAKETRETQTNEDGRFEFRSVAPGNYSIVIELPGFKVLKIKSVIVEGDRLTNVDAVLQLTGKMEMVGFLVAEPSLIDTPPGTTIFNEKMIQSLPHQK